jgi:hypothetical protein
MKQALANNLPQDGPTGRDMETSALPHYKQRALGRINFGSGRSKSARTIFRNKTGGSSVTRGGSHGFHYLAIEMTNTVVGLMAVARSSEP